MNPLLVLLGRALTRPGWILPYIRWRVNAGSDADHQKRVNEHKLYSHSLTDAVRLATGASRSDLDEARESGGLDRLLGEIDHRLTPRTTTIPISWGAAPELATACYLLTRLMRARVVVETGVANGVTSCFMLHAMDLNGTGRLVSLDLPALTPGVERSIGMAVPNRLRSRWQLILGDSRALLPRVVQDAGPLDVFVHDSEHAYTTMISEFTTVWPFMRHGGVLVSDDLNNDAFLDFAERVRRQPLVVVQGKKSPFGLLIK